MGKPHKHAEVIKAWVDDPEQVVQVFNEDAGEWQDLDCTPTWAPFLQYRIKPKTININGYEVPEPVREPLGIGKRYYVVSPYGSEVFNWAGDRIDYDLLKNGAIHLTKEAAQLHSEAIYSFTRKP